MNKFNFEVETRPLMYTNVEKQVAEDDRFKVIIRDDNSKVLSVMKNSYEPLFNREMEKITEDMMKVSGFEFESYKEFKDGAIVLANLRNTKGDVTLFNHKIEDYLILGSSHDGSYPFFIGTAMVNVWCQNQFSKISKVMKVRHTASSEVKRTELLNTLEVYFKQREKIYEDFVQFQKVQIPEELRREVLARILDISREDLLLDKVSTRKLTQLGLLRGAYETEAAEYGHNAYAIFNGATRFTTHILNSKDKIFGNFHNVPGWINQKAYSVAKQLVEA